MNIRETTLLKNRLDKIKVEVGMLLTSAIPAKDRKPKLQNLYKAKNNINEWLKE